MVRYSEWHEATDPERPLACLDGTTQLILALFGGALGTLCCGLLTIPGFLLAWRETGDGLLLKRVERLRDVPSRHAQVACRLSLIQGTLIYGRDEGLVSLIDGTLLFEGRRTSFSFFLHRTGMESAKLVGGRFIVYFDTPTGRAQALVEGVSRDEIEECYGEWLKQSSVPSDDLVLPPSRPDRQAWRAVGRLRQAAVAVSVGGIVAFAAAVLNDLWQLGTLLATGAAFLALLLRLTANHRNDGLQALEPSHDAPRLTS